MNAAQIGLADPAIKVALTTPNMANAVLQHLMSLEVAPLVQLRLPGTYIAGSNVHRPAQGLPVDASADVDIIVEGDETLAFVRGLDVIDRLHLVSSGFDTFPSMLESRDQATMPGVKYLTVGGKTVDLWGMADVHRALMQFPEHSHASSRIAWDCQNGCLIMYPNTQAAT